MDPGSPIEAKVWLEGGEAIRLFVKEDAQRQQRRLVHERYTDNLRYPPSDKIDETVLDEQNRSFFVGAHQPEREQLDTVRFEVSIQNGDAETFSPRPAESWIEVRPRGAAEDSRAASGPPGHASPSTPNQSDNSDAYIFYDACFEPERPVPVVSCMAQKWPTEAKQAEIRAWFKLDKTPPDREIIVRDLREQPHPLSNMPDVQFEIETKLDATPNKLCKLIVTERHKPGDDLYTVKVEVDPMPEKIQRSFNSKAGTVRHEFYYPESSAAKLDEVRVKLTTKEKLSEGAIILKPIVILVPPR
jgi:hypothetical protein